MKQIGEKTPICFLLPNIPPSRSCGGLLRRAKTDRCQL